MRGNKIGTVFLVSTLALAGIGFSYAGFFDEIAIHGDINTAYVDIDWIGWYSGCVAWKVWNDDGSIPTGTNSELFTYCGWWPPYGSLPTEADVKAYANSDNAEFESNSYAGVGSGDYDVNVYFNNLFPCTDFKADFIFHYGGSIPAKIKDITIKEIDLGTSDDMPETGENFVKYLIDYNAVTPGRGIWVQMFEAIPLDADGNVVEIRVIPDDIKLVDHWCIGTTPLPDNAQLHWCDFVYVVVKIHLPQVPALAGLIGAFGINIQLKQWYDPADCT